MWKDVIFGGWMLLFILFLYDVVESKGSLLLSFKGLGSLALLCFLISFGRNNGFYIILLVLLTLSFYLRSYYKKLVPIFTVIVISISLVQGPVYTALNITKSPFVESLAVPLQQIGYTANSGGYISHKNKEFINKFIPFETMKMAYGPATVDYIKFHKSFNKFYLNDNKMEFIKVWADIMTENELRYMKSYLMQTLGYYHIGSSSWVCQFEITDNNFNIQNTDYVKSILGVDLQDNIKASIVNVRKIPLISNLYSIGFSVWLSFFCILVLVVKKRTKYIIPIIPLVALWITIMIAAPTFCEFRYMFSFHLAMPFLIILLFLNNSNEAKPIEERV
jgi:hypothetical protein